MRFVTYQSARGPRAGLLVDLHVLDCADAADHLGLPALPSRLADLLQEGEPALELARLVLQRTGEHGAATAAYSLPLAGATLLAPIPHPGKIVAVGRNYREHVRERSETVPTRPLLFAKLPSAVVGQGAAVTRPHGTKRLDYEGELALVIGRRCSRLRAAEAMACVAGYMCANDITDRGAQDDEVQWLRAKSSDSFCPLGPELVTADEVADPQRLALRTRVNGELRQDDSTASMIFAIAELLTEISSRVTLEPGDVVLTGTPVGVGDGMRPARYLEPGDEVEVEIEGLGRLVNTIGAP